MGIQLISLVTSLLLISSVSFGAPQKATKTKTKPAMKTTVKKAKTKKANVEAELEKELNAKVQNEPTTKIEATPLEPSQSAMMREKRRQMELETEEEIAQELEASRMADERTRRNRVFGAKAVPVKNEIRTETSMAEEDDDSDMAYYMGLTGGLVESRAANVDGAGALGLSLGAQMLPHSTPWGMGSLAVEGGFIYSLLEGTTESLFGSYNYDVDKYTVSASARYELETGWFVPGAGLVMAYTRRDYQLPGEDNFSNALDFGAAITGDVRFNKTVSVGLEYRYMTNLDYEKDRGSTVTDVAAQKAVTDNEVKNLEDIDYQIILLNGKISF